MTMPKLSEKLEARRRYGKRPTKLNVAAAEDLEQERNDWRRRASEDQGRWAKAEARAEKAEHGRDEMLDRAEKLKCERGEWREMFTVLCGLTRYPNAIEETRRLCTNANQSP